MLSCWVRSLVLLLAASSALIAHDVKIVPIDEDFLLPIVTADVHVSASPTTLDFGEVGIGSSPSLPLLISNPSEEEQAIEIALVDGSHLSLGTGDASFSLPAGAFRVVRVSYSPVDVSDTVDTLLQVVASDPRGYSQEEQVAVVGTARELFLRLELQDPSTQLPVSNLDFGTSEVGETVVHSVRLVNTGEDEVTGRILGLANFVSAPCWWDVCFYQSGSYPASPVDADYYTLAVGDFLDIDVVFAPSHEWDSGSTSVVTFDGGDEPLPDLLLQVAATDPDEDVAEAHLALDPSFHDFGTLAPGDSQAQVLTLTNSGSVTAQWSISGVQQVTPTKGCRSLSGQSDALCFSPFDGSLTRNSEQSIVVTFSPSAASDIDPFLESFTIQGGAQPALFTTTGAAPSTSEGNGAVDTGLLPTELGLRGLVNENTFLSSMGLDHINTMNGNLVVTLPIGPQRQVGPSLSHGLSLVYNSSAWDPVPAADIDSPAWGNWWHGEPSSAPAFGTNAGLGWRLSVGELYAPVPSNNPSGLAHWPADRDNHWVYIGPDGSKVYFAFQGGQWIAIGNSRLRLRTVDATRVLDFPDGTKHVFVNEGGAYCYSTNCWRLQRIEDAFGNHASFGFVGFEQAGAGTATITIAYPPVTDRWTKIVFQRNVASSDPDKVRLELQKVEFSGGYGTYYFDQADRTVPRGCISGAGIGGDIANLAMLTRVRMPQGLTYDFGYVAPAAAGTDCDPAGSLLERIDLPTKSRIHYRWTDVRLPGLCEGDLPETGGYSHTQGVQVRSVFALKHESEAEASTSYTYSLRNPVLFEDPRVFPPGTTPPSNPTPCVRETTAVTDVIHWPDMRPDDQTAESYLGERFYHTVLRPDGQSQDEGGQWIKAVYGLPVDMSQPKSGNMGAELWLSSESAECPTESYSGCTVLRKEYKRFKILETNEGAPGATGWDRPWEDKVRYQRRRDVMVRDRSEDIGGNTVKWIESYRSNWDGRGHYRQTATRSNYRTNSPSPSDDTIEFTNYNPGISAAGIGDNLPSSSSPWLLGLFDEKRTNTTGVDRIQEFEFDADGFLECHRVLKGLSRSTADVATRYSRVTSGTNGNRGVVDWEGIAGGDSGDAGSSSCPVSTSDFQLWTDYDYSYGVRTFAQPMVDGFAIGPQTLDLTVQASTGWIQDSCDHSTGSPTCEKYAYDALGRRTVINRGWYQNSSGTLIEKTAHRLADSRYTYSLRPLPDGGATIEGKLFLNGTSGLLDSEMIVLDGLGREIEYQTATSAGTVVQRNRYHGRGFKTQEVTPKLLGASRPCEDDGTFCLTTYRYDVFGRVTYMASPSLNDLNAPFAAGVRQVTKYHRGTRNYEVVRRPYQGGVSKVETWSDHLGRAWKTREDGARLSITAWNGDLTSTTRDLQTRKVWTDGRGFVYKEKHPEWNGQVALYEYDALGNRTKETQPDGTIIKTLRDGLGRPTTVQQGTVELKRFVYGGQGDKLSETRRLNQVDCNGYTGSASCSGVADIKETFGYDTNGQLDSRVSLLYWGAQTVFKKTQSWSYDSRGRVETVTYPDCVGQGGVLGVCSAPASRTVGLNYTKGDLVGLDLGNLPFLDLAYHANGLVKRADHYEGGSVAWSDLVSVPDSGVSRVERIEVARGSTVHWDSGELIYNADGMLHRLYNGTQPNLTLSYDPYFRLTGYIRGSQTRTYSFDDYDNLLSMSAPSYTYTMDSATNQIASVVIGGNTYPLHYDDRGFVSGFVGNQMDYDPFGQMTRYEDPTAGLEAHYFYNASDQRIVTLEHVGAGDETATFLGRDHSGKILRKFERVVDGAGSYEDLVWAGRQVRAVDPGTGVFHHVHADHLGSTRLTTRGGAVQSSQEYEPWGQLIESEGVVPLSIGFTGTRWTVTMAATRGSQVGR